MPYGLYLSAAGANAQSHRLEVLSHNLANVNTAGFKPHMAMLQSRHSGAIERGEAMAGSGTVDDIGGGILINAAKTQFAQGTIQPTGTKTDFAINDKESFFTVKHGEQELLTRAGNFIFDSDGKMVTTGGDEVVSTSGSAIRINPTRAYQITGDGAVLQDGTRQLPKIVKPREMGDLSRVGENLFESLTQVAEVPNEQRSVISGALESSGVEPTGAMMQLIEASRTYEANVRMIQTQDEAMGQLISRVLRQG
ncbi:MAG: flagellar hook basal-body protein [Pirellulaceae bacterium]